MGRPVQEDVFAFGEEFNLLTRLTDQIRTEVWIRNQNGIIYGKLNSDQ
jgi:hypothetical protein